jgi:hypothetical protein
LNAKQRQAIDLLESHPVQEVADALKVQTRTIRRWMKEPEFMKELRARDKETTDTLARVANHAAMHAAIKFDEAASSGKLDPKISFETLKLCSAYDRAADDTDALGELMRQIASEPDED